MDKLTVEDVAIKKWFGMLPIKFQKLKGKKKHLQGHLAIVKILQSIKIQKDMGSGWIINAENYVVELQTLEQ